MKPPAVYIDRVARLEAELASERRNAAAALRARRERAGLSLRQASPIVGLSAGGLSLLERAETWETRTARRVLAAYDPPGRTEAA